MGVGMLEALRLFANSWPAKVFLALIILSFAFIWAVPFYNNNSSFVLSSGQSTLPRSEFIYRVNKALANLSIALNQTHRLNASEAERMGLLPNIMQELNFNLLMNEEARLMKLNLSDSTIAKLLAKDEFFKINGSFSKDRFINYVNNMGLLKKDIINAYKKDGQNEQLLKAVVANQCLPQIFKDSANSYQQQKIDVDYLVVDKNNLLPVASPEMEDLQKWFDLHKTSFNTKEVRDIEFIHLSKDVIAKEQNATDKEIEDYYKTHLDNYTTEEKRDYDLLSIKTKEAAEAITKKNPSSINFENLQKADAKNLTLEHKTNILKKDLTTPLSTEIFALSPNSYSKVIEDKNKFYIAHLIKVTPKQTKPFEPEKKSIEEIVKKTKTDTELDNNYKRINIAIAEKGDLAKIATDNKLELLNYTIDTDGKLANKAAPIANKADWDKITRSIFHARLNAKPQDVALTQDGYVWYKVKNITPARQKTFEEAKSEIIKDYEDANTQKALNKRAEELRQELDDGASVAQLGEENNLPIKQIKAIDRSGANGSGDTNIPDSIYQTILSYSKNNNFVQQGETSETRLVLHIANIYKGQQSAANSADDIIKQFNESLKNDILFAMELEANKQHPLKVNNWVVKQLLANM